MTRRNYFVKRWIITALSTVDKPIPARTIVDIIKKHRDPKINRNSRRSANISAVKVGAIVSRMKEVKVIRAKTNSQRNLYEIKPQYRGLYGDRERGIYERKKKQ